MNNKTSFYPEGLKDLKIYLLDIRPSIVEAWYKFFNGFPNVSIINLPFKEFMTNNSKDIECIVSPGNSFGLMDGGYDESIIDYFGSELMEEVQKTILNKFYGEQPITMSTVIDIPNTSKKLIHTPTMRFPSKIMDPLVVYQSMRTCLMCAMYNNAKSIVIPAFGAHNGGLEPDVVAHNMYRAYIQLLYKPEKIDWEYVRRNKF